jgi:hypothetical protein
MDSELQPQPQMVGGWTASDDKLTYTFTLRNGLRFHDGQPVRAADVRGEQRLPVSVVVPGEEAGCSVRWILGRGFSGKSKKRQGNRPLVCDWW